MEINTVYYSVIINTCNRRSLLQYALASVLKQTLPASEIIIIDDHSDAEHDCSDLAKMDPRISIIRNQKRLGGVGARNAGLKLVKHSLVAFLDDDDEWLPQKMERQIDFLQQHPQYVAVSCGRLVVNDSFSYSETFAEKEARDLFHFDNVYSSFSFLTIRRNEFTSSVFLDENFQAAQDWDFLLCLRNHGPIGFISDVLAKYSNASHERITSSFVKKFDAIQKLLKKHGHQFTDGERRWMKARLCFLQALAATNYFQKLFFALKGVFLGCISSFPFKRKRRSIPRFFIESFIGFNRMQKMKAFFWNLRDKTSKS